MKKNLESVIKFLIYLSFITPLIFLPSSFIFPFIVPKVLFFRSLVILMSACYVFLLMINWKEYRPRFTPLNLVLTAFLASFALSTIVGTDPYHSFWDNHERMLGLFTIFHYVAYYFICGSVFKTWKDWSMALKLFLMPASVVMIMGFMQVGNPEMFMNQGSSRVASTLGNPIYVGGLGLFMFFAALLLFFKEKNRYWRYLEALFGLFGILGMFFSGTRGSMLGLAVGLTVVLIGYAIFFNDRPKLRKGAIGILLLGVLMVGVLYSFRKTDFVKNLPAVGRTLNTGLEDVKNSGRWIAWEIALEAWRERPIFGWGPNNYFYAFNLHYQARSLEFGYGETWFDNAHNIVLNTLAVQGFIGLVVYLAVFVFAGLVLVGGVKTKKTDRVFAVIGVGFLAAHFTHNITVFENVTSYLYLMLWLAMINQQTSPAEEERENKKPDKQLGGFSYAAAAILCLLFIFVFNVQPGRANGKALLVLRVLPSRPASAVPLMKEALEFNSPHIDDIRSDIGRSVQKQIVEIAKTSPDLANEIGDIGYEAVLKNLELHPLDIRNHIILTQISQDRAYINNDAKYLEDAEKFLEQASEKSPDRQQLLYSLSAIKVQLGKTQEAGELLKKTAELDPVIGETYWRLASLYKTIGDDQAAFNILKAAMENGVNFTSDDQIRVNLILSELSASPPTESLPPIPTE